MNELSYSRLLTLAAPETILAMAAVAVLAVDLLVMREQPLRVRFWIGAAFAGFGCVAAMAWLLAMNPPAQLTGEQLSTLPLLRGMYVDDPLARLVKVALLGLTLFTIAISLESRFTRHVGEYLALLLLAALGMLLLASSEDLLMLFISLELTSLSLYVLTAFNKRRLHSAEAALKYFLFGGMSAAFTLFGLSLVYGLAGSADLRVIGTKLHSSATDPLLIAALVMTAIGFAFKVAVAPFHLWAPDVYQGAPTPSAAFIASGSKLAGFFVLARVMIVGFAPAHGSAALPTVVSGWLPLLAMFAVGSMVLGNLAAIAQSNVKRLLAYSAIGHGGYVLLGVLANGPQGLTALVYYAVTYGLTIVGAFGVAGCVEDRAGEARLADFAGLGRREPLLAFCMLIFLLSLAGIPPLAGFFGKFYLFVAAADGAKDMGLLWLVILGVAMSAVSLYYYLQVLKQIYVVPLPAGHPANSEPLPLSSKLAIGLLAATVVLLGGAPNLLVGPLLKAMPGAGF